MYLTVNNQLTMLHDLLDEQLIYKTVTREEYKRIKSLVQTIMTNGQIESELLSILPQIYYFGIKGENANSFLNHITDNEANIEEWLHAINETKMNII